MQTSSYNIHFNAGSRRPIPAQSQGSYRVATCSVLVRDQDPGRIIDWRSRPARTLWRAVRHLESELYRRSRMGGGRCAGKARQLASAAGLTLGGVEYQRGDSATGFRAAVFGTQRRHADSRRRALVHAHDQVVFAVR